MGSGRVPYAELHSHSAYSFLDGASLPSELAERAAELGLDALALTDHDGFPGIMQMAEASRETGLPIAPGTELAVGVEAARTGRADPEGEHAVLLAGSPEGYRLLSHTVGQAMLASGRKGVCFHTLEGLAEASGGHWTYLTGCRKGAVRRALEKNRGTWAPQEALRELSRIAGMFGKGKVVVELTNSGAPLDRERNQILAQIARRAGVRYAATGNVHYSRPSDRPVADVLAATRANMPLDSLDPYLPAHGAYLRSGAQMLALHRENPEAVEQAAAIGVECAFDLSLVAGRMPDFPVPDGYTEGSWLRELTYRRAAKRYGSRSAHPRAWRQIDHELDVIIQTGFPGYFLIVEEIVDFCRRNGIWCQGRGSAANSAVCFALGITAVDAVRHRMLFERFLSPGRSGPPDIDVDIESGRREEVIQHVYERYGRSHAAQVANAITYRPRSAIRDAARALGYDAGQAERWSKSVERRIPATPGRFRDPTKELACAAEAAEPRTRTFARKYEAEVPADVMALAEAMQRLPRHLGIHSGGMVLCEGEIIDVCPVGWASMPGRTVLQWDKDDCAEAGLVKFDLLGLGMLTALRLAFTELERRGVRGADGRILGLHNLAQDDPEVYRLLQEADTVGVFQVESRAQMATLPRLRPECFYDIVIEVALIRPGPIQGHSVNPYLNRRRGREPVTYPHPSLRPALEKTLGVPLFQEQLMQIAIDAAGFSPAQADRLRKAMGAKRSHERVSKLHDELIAGMERRGIDGKTAEEIYGKLEGFAEFGFPESHSFSFAYLVYASAWLKVHHPEEFYLGILGAQPMGFYSPQTLVADAKAHDVRVLPPCVVHSQVAPCLETTAERTVRSSLVHPSPTRAVRLGLSAVKGLGEGAARIVAARERAPFADAADLARRARLSQSELEALASAGALAALGVGRREGVWMARALREAGRAGPDGYQEALPGTEAIGSMARLPRMSEAEEAAADIAATGLSVDSYPTQFLRPGLDRRGVLRVGDLSSVREGVRVHVAGVVTHRQRPHTAKGTTFLSIEDETGLLNVVCSPGLWARYRDAALFSQGLVVRGMVERGDGAMNFVADALEPLELHVAMPSRDFR